MLDPTARSPTKRQHLSCPFVLSGRWEYGLAQKTAHCVTHKPKKNIKIVLVLDNGHIQQITTMIMASSQIVGGLQAGKRGTDDNHHVRLFQ
jgi:hypothetical protein